MREMERALAQLVACHHCLMGAIQGGDWAGAAVLTEVLNGDVAGYRERLGLLVLLIGQKLAASEEEAVDG